MGLPTQMRRHSIFKWATIVYRSTVAKPRGQASFQGIGLALIQLTGRGGSELGRQQVNIGNIKSQHAFLNFQKLTLDR